MALIISCNNIYKAGNSIPLLEIQVETNVNQQSAFELLDSSKVLAKYHLPDTLNKLLIYGGDLEYFPNSNKCIFFSSNPSEVYHLNSSGVFKIQQVYNKNLDQTNWISDRNKISLNDLGRIEKRIDSFLHDVVVAGREAMLPDSVIFWRKPYNIIDCRLLKE